MHAKNSVDIGDGWHTDLDQARRVLVVDDSRLQRKILASLLHQAGYQVIEALSAQDALDICLETPPDIVISDWIMQGMTGLELCQILRRHPDLPYPYFMLLTSKQLPADIAEGLDAGADDFLTKPVSGTELRARLGAGERILDMNAQLLAQNGVLRDTLQEVERLKDAVDKDLIEARKLQQSLVPVRHQKFQTAQVSLLQRASNFVGGDLVGFYPAGSDHIGIFSLDVSGHGISSALMTARLAGYLSPIVLDQNVALQASVAGGYEPLDPIDVVRRLNARVLDEMETEHYFTMILGDLNLKTGLVRLCQAGHPHPLVQRADGRIEQSSPGGFPVGLLADAKFSEFEIQLNPGDRLMLPSDGITECANPGGDLLEEAGLEQIAQDLESLMDSAFLEAFMWRLSEFHGSSKMQDDVSLLLLDYTGP